MKKLGYKIAAACCAVVGVFALYMTWEPLGWIYIAVLAISGATRLWPESEEKGEGE